MIDVRRDIDCSPNLGNLEEIQDTQRKSIVSGCFWNRIQSGRQNDNFSGVLLVHWFKSIFEAPNFSFRTPGIGCGLAEHRCLLATHSGFVEIRGFP
jgi:hypothetical protein